MQRVASGMTVPAVKNCTLVLPQRRANQSLHRHSGRPQHDTCGRRVCCTAPCPWEWNAREWGVSVERREGLKIRASKHWLAHHRGFLLHLSQPITTAPRNPSEAVRTLPAVIFGFSGVTVPYSPPPSAQNTTSRLRHAQAHTKAMLWPPRSPRTAAQSVARRSALPPAASSPEGLRTASAGGGGGGGGVNPPKETDKPGDTNRIGFSPRLPIQGIALWPVKILVLP